MTVVTLTDESCQNVTHVLTWTWAGCNLLYLVINIMDEFVNYILLLLVLLPVVLFINLWTGIGWELFVNN